MPSTSFDIWIPVSNFFRTSPSLLKRSSLNRTCFCSLLDVHPIYKLSSWKNPDKTEENVYGLRGKGEKETPEQRGLASRGSSSERDHLSARLFARD